MSTQEIIVLLILTLKAITYRSNFFTVVKTWKFTIYINPIALRKAKLYGVLAFLSAIGLRSMVLGYGIVNDCIFILLLIIVDLCCRRILYFFSYKTGFFFIPKQSKKSRSI